MVFINETHNADTIMANSIEKENRSDSITINVNEFNQLHEARQFSKIPLAIIDYFHDQDIAINGKAIVLMHHKKTEWYIIDKTVPFWIFFHLKVGKRSRNNFPLLITRETPDFNQSQFNPRTRNGIEFKEDAQLFDPSILYESGGFVLDKKQQQKADYFFKIAANQKPLKHERAIYQLATWGEDSYKNLTISIAKVGAFSLISLVIFLSTYWIVFLFIMGIALYAGFDFFKKMFTDFWANYKRNEIFNQAIKQLEKEREILANESGNPLVSDQKMEAWLAEEMRTLDREALQTFQWSATDVLSIDPALHHRNTVGLSIEEWGLLQPFSTKGKVDNSLKHLRAFRFNGKQPLYGVYYVVFFYFTKEMIGIYSCFYDFIQAKSIQAVARQYTYYDLAKMDASIEPLLFEEGIQPLETQRVVLHFFNQDRLPITLSDHLAITNLKNKIEGIDPEAEEVLPATPTQNPELKKLFQLPEQQLTGYRSYLTLIQIHYFWNQQKRQPIAIPEVVAASPPPINQQELRYV